MVNCFHTQRILNHSSRPGPKTQTRNTHAVINHLNFCMRAVTVTWIYADRIDFTPQRCHAVNNRQHFAFWMSENSSLKLLLIRILLAFARFA